jgi:SAM-dependent methyltransferase
MTADLHPTERFSDRAAGYTLYRPGYPREILGALERCCGLTPSAVVADIGSGTGKLTELFLDYGNLVYAIEPNDAMRTEAEKLFAGHAGFVNVKATAESTTLPGQSVDLIAAGQAFHWFDAARARSEFRRILRPTACVALIWNSRVVGASDFMRTYEALMAQYGPDYPRVHRDGAMLKIEEFFDEPPVYAEFPNDQFVGLEGLLGRAFSSSYAPKQDQPGHEQLRAGLEALFYEHQEDGFVRFVHRTQLYSGRLG